MGSSKAAPTWVAITAIASVFFLGKVQFLITTFFLVAPIIMMFTASKLLKRLTTNSWISVPAAFLYAISPVAIAAVSTGHIATVLFLILAPYVALLLQDIERIQDFTWRKIAGISLLLALLYGFSLMIFVIGFVAGLISTLSDYEKHAKEANAPLYSLRMQKRAALILVPFIMNVPFSLEAIINPSRLLVEPGLLISGGDRLTL